MRALLLSLPLLLGLAGPSVAQAGDVQVSIVYGDARHPPAPIREKIPPGPNVVGATWVPGRWDHHWWKGYWEWIPGYWALPDPYYGPRVGVYYDPWPRNVVIVRPSGHPHPHHRHPHRRGR